MKKSISNLRGKHIRVGLGPKGRTSRGDTYCKLYDVGSSVIHSLGPKRETKGGANSDDNIGIEARGGKRRHKIRKKRDLKGCAEYWCYPSRKGRGTRCEHVR